jgi:hypothetical protein
MKPIVGKPPLPTLCVPRVRFSWWCLLGICGDSAPRACSQRRTTNKMRTRSSSRLLSTDEREQFECGLWRSCRSALVQFACLWYTFSSEFLACDVVCRKFVCFLSRVVKENRLVPLFGLFARSSVCRQHWQSAVLHLCKSCFSNATIKIKRADHNVKWSSLSLTHKHCRHIDARVDRTNIAGTKHWVVARSL